MQFIHAAILGVIQGLTEFLPVSSSGHLILARELFGWELLAEGRWNTVFDVAVHAGTFAALVAYFRPDIGRLLGAFFATFRHGFGGVPERRLAWMIAIGTVPAALAGLLGEDAIEGVLRRAPMLVAALLIAFGVILWLAERLGAKAKELRATGWLDGILVGLAQMLALAPGVSRSGITMTAGLARGLTRETAARFSFLLSIPIMAGAALWGLRTIAGEASAMPDGSVGVFAAGFLSAACSGYLCIRYFLRHLQSHSLAPFIIYRIALGLSLLAWFGLRR